MKSWYLVAYDVRDPKRLANAAKTLKGYGTRLQYSVFRCHLSKREMERLRWELSQVLAKEDDILFVGLCDACIRKIRSRSSSGSWPEEPPGWVVL